MFLLFTFVFVIALTFAIDVIFKILPPLLLLLCDFLVITNEAFHLLLLLVAKLLVIKLSIIFLVVGLWLYGCIQVLL
jgi:hypothetical protein